MRKGYYLENKDEINRKNRENYYKNKEQYKRRAREWAMKNTDKRKIIEEAYRKSEKGILNNRKRKEKERKRHPKRIKARQEANYRIKIPKGQICEGCRINKAIQRHHPDYSKPLKIKFLCSSCHRKEDRSRRLHIS